MKFGEAVEVIKAGGQVAREGWNGKGMYLYLVVFPGFEPCITMYTAQGLFQPGWLASQADILSDDWVVVVT